jgi:hypothetical protein
MVKIDSIALVAALVSLCDVQGMQLEESARRPNSWIKHATVSGKVVDKEQIEVCDVNHTQFCDGNLIFFFVFVYFNKLYLYS